MYEKDFTKENRIMGVLWSNKRDSGLLFAPTEQREDRLGIQVLPSCPISEVFFSNVKYVKDLVEWTMPALKGVSEKRKGFLYDSQGIYDNEGGVKNIKCLKMEIQ